VQSRTQRLITGLLRLMGNCSCQLCSDEPLSDFMSLTHFQIPTVPLVVPPARTPKTTHDWLVG